MYSPSSHPSGSLGGDTYGGNALAAKAISGCSSIVELRQYTLHPGRRRSLIDLFDGSLIEPQEKAGMTIVGQFRDLDDPDRFVWLRGFDDMAARAESLAEFYGGPVWQAHREAANAAMVDSDDVLLLRPARRGSAFTLAGERLAHQAPAGGGRGFVAATIMHLEAPAAEAEVLSFFEQTIAPRARDNGGSILAYFVTEPSRNSFPRLPVREGEHVFVWFGGFADRGTLERVAGEDGQAGRVAARAPGLRRPPQVLRLAPTARSLLDGRSPPCTVTNLHSENPKREERQ